MPVRSKQQLKYMYAVKNGDIKNSSLNKKQAQEFIFETKSTKGLPEKVKKKKRFSGLLG